MEFKPLTLDGALLMIPKKHQDPRGFFTELFREDQWVKQYGSNPFLQDNFSWSAHGVVRGLHFQDNPPQGKLITCLFGQIVDVLVDIRAGSPTFGKHVCIELNGERPMWVWAPPGFAHGFAVTSEAGAAVLYKVDNYYNAASDRCIRWDDPTLNVEWPDLASPLVSAKDQAAPSFEDYAKSPLFRY
ncbi:MAG: dTDP-4-dehydrorhamnose 3,5-epimerase [Calothrix sp. SM1_5_4]|nr:dTDP-4-dehydrorhamnose 3,5-epimerase [Calothrix sp. SM1_5_4]